MENYLYGIYPILEALQANRRKFYKLFVNLKNNKENKILGFCQQNKIPIEYITEEKLVNMSQSEQHQNFVLHCSKLPLFSLNELLNTKKNKNLWVALSQLQNVQNIGAILRSCVYFGVDTVFLSKHQTAAISNTISKISAGAMERVKFCLVSNFNYLIDNLKKKNFWIVGTSLNGKIFTKQIVPDNCLLLLGNEKQGIKKLTEKKCDFLWKIEGANSIQSLNVAAAAAIFINHIYTAYNQ